MNSKHRNTLATIFSHPTPGSLEWRRIEALFVALNAKVIEGFFNKSRGNTMNTLSYKGYTAKVEFDPEDNILFGNIIGIRDTVGFHGDSVGELKDAFQEAVDFYLESCEKAGREPNKPFSGKFVVRVDSSLHGEIAAAAVHAGKSLNKWVADTLKQNIHTH